VIWIVWAGEKDFVRGQDVRRERFFYQRVRERFSSREITTHVALFLHYYRKAALRTARAVGVTLTTLMKQYGLGKTAVYRYPRTEGH